MVKLRAKSGGRNSSPSAAGARKNKKGVSQWDSDHYSKQAKKDNYPARSVYKLQEIQAKHKVMRRGDRILDLGCSPGSWLIYAGEIAGKTGVANGIDLKPVDSPLASHVTAYVGDILNLPSEIDVNVGKDYDVVISDMAPATTGRKDVDALRSYELCRMALTVAEQKLKIGGAFVCKIFQGGDFKMFTDEVTALFKKCHIFKPQSCRSASKEIFIIGTGKK